MRRDRPAIITAADTAAFVRPGNTAGIYRSASYGRIVKAVFDRTCIIAGHSAYRHSVRCDCTRSKILSVFKYPLVASGNAADGIITNYRAAVLSIFHNTAGIIFTYDTANAADTHNISAIYMPFNISAVFNIFDQTVVVTADTANFTAAAIL